MPKQLIIEHCNECSLRDDYVGFKFPRCMYPCSVFERHKEIKQEDMVNGFPTWCPLPDAKGGESIKKLSKGSKLKKYWRATNFP